MGAPAYIGPLIPDNSWPLRYAAATVVVMGTVLMRASLAPALGTQSPLLPFLLTVFVSAYLGGRGPALLASFLTPVAATIWFTAWPHDAPPLQWAAHVAFFLLIGTLSAWLMGELQGSARAQLRATRAAAENAERATQSERHMRLIADAMPALISYIGARSRLSFRQRHLREMVRRTGQCDHGSPRARRARRRKPGNTLVHGSTAPSGASACSSSRTCPLTAACARSRRTTFRMWCPDGQVRGCFALVEDISGRKRAERALREVDRRKDDFLAMLAHELRNPLTPIRNVAHILGRGQSDPVTIRRSAELLERQASHLTHLVDDLLDVARITRGRITLRREPLNLGGRGRHGARDREATARIPRTECRDYPYRGAAVRGGRQGAALPGDLQPAEQRDQVLARTRAHRTHAGCHGTRSLRGGARRRDRHRSANAAEYLRPVSCREIARSTACMRASVSA